MSGKHIWLWDDVKDVVWCCKCRCKRHEAATSSVCSGEQEEPVQQVAPVRTRKRKAA